LRIDVKRSGAFEIWLRIRFASLDVTGRDEMVDVLPEARRAETNLGERSRGGRDHTELRRRNEGEKSLRTGKSDDVGDLFDFASFHPTIFCQMNGGIRFGKEFAYGSQTSSAVGRADDEIGVEIVLEGPAGPDAGDGGGGVDEHAVHVDEEAFAGDVWHRFILMRYCCDTKMFAWSKAAHDAVQSIS
jgi:hypothetical protein